MKRYKIAVVWIMVFCISFVLKAEDKAAKDVVLNNFFNLLKATDIRSFDVNTFEADMEIEVKLAPSLESYIKSFFPKGSFSSPFKSKGYIRNVLRNTGNRWDIEYAYVYQDTSIGDIVISKVQDKVEVVLPSFGIIISDSLQNIKNVIGQYVPIKEQQNSPFSFAKMIFTYLTTQEKAVREKLQFEREDIKNEVKTYVFSYPLDNGKIYLAIFDGTWTLASMWFEGTVSKDAIHLPYLYVKFEYPFRKDVVTGTFMPESIILKGDQGNSNVSIMISNIKYNKLFSTSDFEIAKMNFQEFAVSMYLKYLQRR